jgi:hypothetical protein
MEEVLWFYCQRMDRDPQGRPERAKLIDLGLAWTG